MPRAQGSEEQGRPREEGGGRQMQDVQRPEEARGSTQHHRGLAVSLTSYLSLSPYKKTLLCLVS